jgi:hypothetical protein
MQMNIGRCLARDVIPGPLKYEAEILDSPGLGHRLVTGSCEHDNELFGFKNVKEFLNIKTTMSWR